MTTSAASAPTSQENPSSRPPLRPGLFRFSATHLLIALVALLVVMPVAEHFRFGMIIESVILTLVLGSAVLVVGAHRAWLVAAIILVTPAIIAKWFDLFQPSPASRAITAASAAVFVAFIAAQLIVFVLRARRVNSEVLCAGISAYLLMGLLFAFAYALTSLAIPGSFAYESAPTEHKPLHGFEALYFSFVTLSTVGFGDIAPVSNVARMLAMLEATTGLFYMSVLIARLVAIYSQHSPPHSSR